MQILSGVQPSGQQHLGNYFGAIRQFLSLQDQQGYKPLYFIADLHALTTIRNGEALRRLSLDVALDYLAFGLDPERATLFVQSDIPEIPILTWILGTVTPVGLLERGHSYKDKIAKGLPPETGLFAYPVLMAADILLYGSDAVPVGKDQKQHLEFARDICTKFNVTYVPDYRADDPLGKNGGTPGILKMPEPYILDEFAVIPGLDGQKMSKSYGNTIELFAPDKVVRKKIMSIKTDSTPVEAPKPADGTLLTFLRLLADENEAQEHVRTWKEGGVGYGTYKKRLVELFFERFGEARARRAELEKDLDYVHQVLARGAEEARRVAKPFFDRVCEATGVRHHV